MEIHNEGWLLSTPPPTLSMQPFATLLLLAIVSCCVIATSADTFHGYRSIHYKVGKSKFGPESAALNGLLVDGALGVDGVALYSLEDILNYTSRAEIESIISSPNDVIISMPPSLVLEELSKSARGNVQLLEQLLVSRSVSKAIYFVLESAELQHTRETIAERGNNFFSSLWQDQFRVLTEGTNDQVSLVKDPKFRNLNAWLFGGESTDLLPVAIISASYDTLQVPVGMPVDVDEARTGVVVLLEIMRQLSNIYASDEIHPTFNLLFVLTGGEKLGSVGLPAVLDDLPTAVLEKVEFALHIDAISEVNHLQLDYATIGAEGAGNIARQQAESMAEAAQRAGVTLHLTDMSDFASERYADPYHEDESGGEAGGGIYPVFDSPLDVYLSRRIPVLHLHSQNPTGGEQEIAAIGSSLWRPAHLIRRKSSPSTDDLQTHALWLAAGLVQSLFPVGADMQLLQRAVIVEGRNDLIDAWMDVCLGWTRAPLNAERSRDYWKALERIMSSYADRVESALVRLNTVSGLKLYDHDSATISVLRTKSAMFDLALLAGVIAYLLGLMVFLNGWDSLLRLLRLETFTKVKRA